LRLAAAHLAAKDEAAAAADMKRALELDPNYLPALLGRVDMAIRAKRFDEALAYARDMQKLKEHAAIGHNIEGDIVLSQGKTAPAIEAYDKAFALNKSPELFIKSSRTMLVAGKVKEAKARITQWVQKNPNDVPASLLLSDIYLMEKAYKPAIASLEALQKRVPNNPLILNNLAWAYQKENDPRALETAEQAYKLASNNAGVVDTLGWILLEQGNASRALPLLQAAQKLAPNSPEISYHLAVGLNKSGDKQGARKELTKLLENNKNFPQQTEAQLLLKSL
jgi:putative PEP-CTERM system TPR-repeat lipoprotein